MTNAWFLLMAAAVIAAIGAAALRSTSRRVFALVLAVPIVNAVTSVTINFSPRGELHSGYARLTFLVIVVAFSLWHVRFRKIELPIYLFVWYICVVTLLSSDVLHSAKVTLGVFLSFALFVIAREYFDSAEKFRRLHEVSLFAALIILVQLVIAQLTGFGQAVYVDDAIRLGGGGVGVTYNLAYTVLLLPIILAAQMTVRRRIGVALLVGASAVAVLLVFRRGSLFGMVAGLVVYSLMGARRRQLAPYALVGAIAAAAVLYAYGDMFMELWRVRTNLERYVDGTAGRAVEWSWIMNDWQDESSWRILFGKEVFNSSAYFGLGRGLHVDYFVLLHGAGLVGLGLYIAAFAAIGSSIWLLSRRVANVVTRRDIRATTLAIIVGSAFMAYSRQIGNVTALSFLLIYLGAIQGMLRSGVWSRRSTVRRGRPWSKSGLSRPSATLSR